MKPASPAAPFVAALGLVAGLTFSIVLNATLHAVLGVPGLIVAFLVLVLLIVLVVRHLRRVSGAVVSGALGLGLLGQGMGFYLSAMLLLAFGSLSDLGTLD